MKKLFLLFAVLTIFGTILYAQPNQAIRLIKIGNTYRETNQFKEAERVLLSGLSSVRQQRDRYWEGVAYENLGLLYRDMEDSLQAIRYLDSAIKIYQQLNLDGSRIAMLQLGESIRKIADAYAGIDIGSTGIKLSILQVTLGPEGHYIYNTKQDSSINANFADLNTTVFESGKNAIRTYFTILSKQKVSPDHIYMAFSSGVLQAAVNRKLNTDSISKVFSQVAQSIMPAYKRPIEFLTTDLEAKFTNLGVVFPKFKEKSVSIDIGGGNTKGGYYNSVGDFESFSVPYGSRFLTLTPKDTTLPENIRDELKFFNQKPGIQNKKEVFFLGGIVWAMVNLLYPEKSLADYVEFSYNDVMDFKRLASGDYTKLIDYSMDKVNRITDIEMANKARLNLRNTENTFTADNLKRGALLLAGIMNELQTPSLKKHYYFLSKGSQIAWVNGYVVTNITERYKNAGE